MLAAKKKHVVGLLLQLPPVWLETSIHAELRKAVPVDPSNPPDSLTLMGASDLEWILSLGLGDSLADVLHGYEHCVAGKPFMPEDDRSGILLTLRDFARSVPGARAPKPLPLLLEVYERFASMVNQEWFGKRLDRGV